MLKIGQSQLRFEDDALITGRGRYMNDLAGKGEAVAVFVRSQTASGAIVSIDISAALGLPDVLGIITGADLKAAGLQPIQPRGKHPGPDGGEMRIPTFYPLAIDAVRYVGDPIAVVVAETKEAALAAAEAVMVEIDERPVVIDPLEAVSPDAPLVWDEFPDNRCFTFEKGDKPGVETAIALAHSVTRQRLRISRVVAAPIETRGAIASYDPISDIYRLELGTQAPHRISGDVAPILNVTPDKLHVVASDCGGSFGMKNAGYPEYPALLFAAKQTGRMLRWASERLESFQSDAHARDMWVDAALALDADGKFLALDVHVRANLGAYLGPATVHPPVANLGGIAGVYRTPKIYAKVDGVFTNTQQTAPYRGAGRPEATYIIERMIDLAAYETGIDRAELRRRNLVPKEAMPYSSGFIFTYDSGDFPGVLDKALEMADWAGFETRRTEAKTRGKLRGIGIANPIEIAGGPAGKPNPEFARMEISPEGKVSHPCRVDGQRPGPQHRLPPDHRRETRPRYAGDGDGDRRHPGNPAGHGHVRLPHAGSGRRCDLDGSRYDRRETEGQGRRTAGGRQGRYRLRDRRIPNRRHGPRSLLRRNHRRRISICGGREFYRQRRRNLPERLPYLRSRD